MKHEIKLRKARGFSLVEMLVVIAVIGIIAAIAVPSIGSISGKANEAQAKRNGQTIASLYNSSRGVGASYTATDTSGIIDELVAGKVGPELAGSEFKMSSLGDDEKAAAMAYVSYDSDADMMSYDPGGGQVAAAAAGPDPEPEPADDGEWTRLANWSVETEAETANAMSYIASNPGGGYTNATFGGNRWRAVQDPGDGRWYLEFQPE